MKRVDIFDSGLSDEIIDANEPCVITIEGVDRYILMPYEAFMENDDMSIKPQEIRVIAPGDIEINEIEYEEIKKQLLNALEEALGPKVKKLS